MAFPLLLNYTKEVLGNGLTGLDAIAWLLRDEFTTARAAGAVNGTAAEPGPGTRAVTDTAPTLDITSGYLSFDGRAGANDPWLEYGSISRTAGRLMLINMQTNSGLNRINFGFAVTSKTSSNGAGIFLFGSPQAIRIRDDAIVTTNSLYASITVYSFAVALRGTGSYYLVKGGAYTNWTLVWVSSLNSSTPLYPFAAVDSSIPTDTRVNWMRIPQDLWLPTPLCYDTFTRANGALGNSETTGPDSQAVTARAWTDQIGTWAIATNVAACSALSGGIGIATVPAGSANVLVDAALTRGSGTAGVVCRYAADNYIYAIHNGTNAQLVKVVGGTPTTLINAAATYSAGAVIRVILDGSSVSLFYNNAQVGTTQTVSDAGILSNTAHGLYATDIDSTLNNFLVMPRGNGGEYSKLDTWSA